MDKDNFPIENLKNLGDKSSTWLRKVGVRTQKDLADVGAVKAFLMMEEAEMKPSLNFLYAMAGALANRHVLDINKECGAALLRELEDMRELRKQYQESSNK